MKRARSWELRVRVKEVKGGGDTLQGAEIHFEVDVPFGKASPRTEKIAFVLGEVARRLWQEEAERDIAAQIEDDQGAVWGSEVDDATAPR